MTWRYELEPDESLAYDCARREKPLPDIDPLRRAYIIDKWSARGWVGAIDGRCVVLSALAPDELPMLEPDPLAERMGEGHGLLNRLRLALPDFGWWTENGGLTIHSASMRYTLRVSSFDDDCWVVEGPQHVVDHEPLSAARALQLVHATIIADMSVRVPEAVKRAGARDED